MNARRCPSHPGRRARRLLVVASGLAIAGISTIAHAGDHTNLEEGLPVEVIDAYPLEFLAREIQLQTQYRYTPRNEHQARVVPRFELGLPYNGQLAVRVPLIGTVLHSDADFHVGRTAVDFMYNFNQETLVIPAFAVVVGVEAPDTKDGGSFDPFGRLAITKMIPGSTLWHRIHLNGLIQPNVERKDDERPWRYSAAVGYDVRLTATSILVLDAVRDQPMKEDDAAANFGELGFRVQITPLLAFALGGGAGATDDGELVARGTAGFQWFAF